MNTRHFDKHALAILVMALVLLATGPGWALLKMFAILTTY